MMSDARLHALRALRDCSVIRANPQKAGFQALYVAGHASVTKRYVDGRWAWDYRLTEAGAAIAADLLD